MYIRLFLVAVFALFCSSVMAAKSEKDISKLARYIYNEYGIEPNGSTFECGTLYDGALLCKIYYDDFVATTFGDGSFLMGFPEEHTSLQDRAKYCSWMFAHAANLSKHDARKMQWRIYEGALDPHEFLGVFILAHGFKFSWSVNFDEDANCHVDENSTE